MKALLSTVKRGAVLSAIFAILASSLAACGGGSGGGAQTAAATPAPGSAPAADPQDGSASGAEARAPAPAADPAPEPVAAPAPAREAHAGVISALDDITDRAHPHGCDCYAGGWLSPTHFSVRSNKERYRPYREEGVNSLGIAADYSRLPARNGVSLAHGDGMSTWQPGDLPDASDWYHIAGWLEHSLMLIDLPPENYYSGHPALSAGFTVGGVRTGENPAAAAARAGADGPSFVWFGAAIAIDRNAESPTFGRFFFGDAMIDIDAPSDAWPHGDVDIAITGWTKQGGTETLADITASNISISPPDAVGSGNNPIHNPNFSHTFFRNPDGTRAPSKTFEGFFYGPNAEEVGGSFQTYKYAAPPDKNMWWAVRNSPVNVSGAFLARLRR